jgi:hypothetical protein
LHLLKSQVLLNRINFIGVFLFKNLSDHKVLQIVLFEVSKTTSGDREASYLTVLGSSGDRSSALFVVFERLNSVFGDNRAGRSLVTIWRVEIGLRIMSEHMSVSLFMVSNMLACIHKHVI